MDAEDHNQIQEWEALHNLVVKTLAPRGAAEMSQLIILTTYFGGRSLEKVARILGKK